MDYLVRPYMSGEEKYVADAHRKIYSQEYQWGDSFLRYATKIALDFPERAADDREELWVAECDGKLVGSIMLCKTDDPAVGQLRLFLVEKAYRGCGVGAALLNALMDKAKASGFHQLILWTASPLADAIRKYEKLGFRFQEEVANTDWSLCGQTIQEIKMQMAI